MSVSSPVLAYKGHRFILRRPVARQLRDMGIDAPKAPDEPDWCYGSVAGGAWVFVRQLPPGWIAGVRLGEDTIIATDPEPNIDRAIAVLTYAMWYEAVTIEAMLGGA